MGKGMGIKKKWIIVFTVVIVIIGSLFGFLYIQYSNEVDEPEKPGENYDKIYEDTADVDQKIEDLMIESGSLKFNQLKESQLLVSNVSDIKEAVEGAPITNGNDAEIEKMTGLTLKEVFADYSKRFIAKRQTSNRFAGFDFSVNRLNGKYETVYFFVTRADLLNSQPIKGLTEVKSSKVNNVEVRVFYNHKVRKNIQIGKLTDQYTYEAVFKKGVLSYYVKWDFTGFDEKLKMVGVTKEESSKGVATLIDRLTK